MPDLLTTSQLADYLQLSERSVYRLLERGEIPALKVGGQWRFRKSAVDEWLDQQVQSFGSASGEANSISNLLSPKNIFLDLPGSSRTEVLATLSEQVKLPETIDRTLLLQRLLEREELCTTALPDGVAVPHTPRTRERLLKDHDVVAVARTSEPVDFGALDGQPTQIFVLVLARDERAHLALVARVTRLVREKSVLKALRSATSPESVLREIADAEKRVFQSL